MLLSVNAVLDLPSTFWIGSKISHPAHCGRGGHLEESQSKFIPPSAAEDMRGSRSLHGSSAHVPMGVPKRENVSRGSQKGLTCRGSRVPPLECGNGVARKLNAAATITRIYAARKVHASGRHEIPHPWSGLRISGDMIGPCCEPLATPVSRQSFVPAFACEHEHASGPEGPARVLLQDFGLCIEAHRMA